MKMVDKKKGRRALFVSSTKESESKKKNYWKKTSRKK